MEVCPSACSRPEGGEAEIEEKLHGKVGRAPGEEAVLVEVGLIVGYDGASGGRSFRGYADIAAFTAIPATIDDNIIYVTDAPEGTYIGSLEG